MLVLLFLSTCFYFYESNVFQHGSQRFFGVRKDFTVTISLTVVFILILKFISYILVIAMNLFLRAACLLSIPKFTVLGVQCIASELPNQIAQYVA